MLNDRTVKEVVNYLKKSNDILFITGAGISAESGLPTYRGIGGLYNDMKTEDGVSIETALGGDMMQDRPDISWKHLYGLEKNCRGASYNRAHEVIAEMERAFRRAWVLTQNIDGFHHAAGSQKIIDIHGDIHNLRCTQCSYRTTVTDYAHLEIPPRCPHCSGIVRPDVVLFGEMLPIKKCQLLQQELEKGFDLIFSIGTTSVFPYIAQPIINARNAGVPTVEINPGITEVSDMVNIRIDEGACITLDRVWNKYKERK